MFGGNCSAGYVCEGDAVMCAIAQEQYRRDCQFYEYAGAQADRASFTEMTSVTGDVTSSSTVTINASSFDSSDAIGSGSGCIKDKIISVWGRQQTIPFSSVCGSLAMLGNLLLFLAWIVSIRIFRG